MEVALSGAAVGAIIGVVLKHLDSLSVEEIGHLWNFKADLQKLKDSLLMIGKFLEDAEMKQLGEESVRLWLMKLEAVAFDADYVIDQVHYKLLRKQAGADQKKTTKEKVCSFFTNSNPIVFRNKINKINKNLNSINQEANDLGLQMVLAGAHPRQAPAYLETDSFTVNQVFVGREKDVAKIVSLATSAPTEQVVSVISIVGMGGLGKTTVAREVFNNGIIKSHFGKQVWVHVSQNNFDPVIVLKSVVASSTGEQNADGSREVLLQKLQTSLGNKKYLLVLDNVWNDSIEKWDSLVASLKGISGNVKGNVIMITTRSENVSSISTTLGVEKLGFLSVDTCWSIIKANAFRGESSTPEFEAIGTNIAKKCGGLPLAAQVVGSMLRGKSKEEWVSIENNWNDHENTVAKILKLSYDNLSSPTLKKCFAFCSIFPKSRIIEKNEMIQLWMAEGYLQTDDEANIEFEGNRVFNLLVQSSLFQVRGRDSLGHVQQFGMHDLVHDLASSALNPKCLDSTCKVRYISRTFSNESSPISEENAKLLRALFFNGKASEIMLSSFKRLHVLILVDFKMKELPSEIRKLICLKYLDISDTKIESLPDSVVHLYHLQTLRATKDSVSLSFLSKLPDKFEYLVNLRHLYIPNIKLPPNIGKLTSLQTLSYFQVGDESGCGIAELGNLNYLKGKIEIYNLEKVRDKEEAERANLIHKPNILKLKLAWNESREGNQNSDENVMEGLQPHPNLKSLYVQGFKGRSFPSWTSRMEVREGVKNRSIRLDNLLEIRLVNCKECTNIPTLGHLPHLKYLLLCNLSMVTSMGTSFYGIEQNEAIRETIVAFGALEKLELIDMENLIEWTEPDFPSSSSTQPREVLVFRRLEYLQICNCPKLKSAPSRFGCLKELQIYGVESASPLVNICGSELTTTLTKLYIAEVDGLVRLPEGLLSSNQDLLELDIRDCNNIKQLVLSLGGGGASLKSLLISDCLDFEKFPEDLHKLNALEMLRIWWCPNLKTIEYPSGSESSSQGFTSLGHLEISCCDGLTELPWKMLVSPVLRYLRFPNCSRLTEFPWQMLESCALSLEELDLTGCTSLTNLPQVMSHLHRMSHLTVLKIKGVPRFSEVVMENRSLGRLEELEIGGCSDCSDYDSFKVIVDRMFPSLRSLRVLKLYGMEHWDAVPDQLHHLTALDWLHLHDFGIEMLGEWIENLSCLKTLELQNCKRLSVLPSKTAMEGLDKLLISDCPLLQQKLEQLASDDSEWSKVSHIRFIIIDGSPFPPM